MKIAEKRKKLQSVIDIDSNLGLAVNSLKKQTHHASKKNSNLFLQSFDNI